jgi:FtsZ-binding cell division protein ZapB
MRETKNSQKSTNGSEKPPAEDQNCQLCKKDEPGSYVMCSMCLSLFHHGCLKWDHEMVKKSADKRYDYYCETCKSCPFLQNKTIQDPIFRKMQQIVEDTVKSVEATIKSDLKCMESKIAKNEAEIEKLLDSIQKIEVELNDLKTTNTAFTQRLVNTDNNVHQLRSQTPRSHDNSYVLSLTAHNVPQLPNENLHDVVSKVMTGLGVPVEPGHIETCRRVKSSNQHQNSNAPMIIIKFVSTYHKDLVWKKYIADKSLCVKDVFPQLNVDSRIYMNLMLSPEKNQIKNEIMRRLIRPGLANRFWIYNGKIHVKNAKKSDENPVVLSKLDDVRALAELWTVPVIE